jgi:hypothetical protein
VNGRREQGNCAIRGLLRVLGPWLIAVAVLIGTNPGTHRWAMGHFIRPNYEWPEHPLQERTFGRNPTYVFDIFDARRRADTKYFFLVGDSSVGSGMMEPETMVATQLQRKLGEALGERVEVVLLSYPGLLVEDALLFVSEALARQPALVYYAVSPRIFLNTGEPAELARGLAGRAAGLAFAREGWKDLPTDYFFGRFSLDRLVKSWVAGTWHLVGDSSAIRVSLNRRCEWEKERLPEGVSFVCQRLFPLPETALPQPAAPLRPGEYLYRNRDLSFEPGPAEAFRLLLERCRSSGRCLLYQTPLNLDSPACGGYFEPGLLDRYLAFLRSSGFGESTHADHSRDLRPARFKNEPLGCDVLHPDGAGRREVAAMLTADAMKALAQQGARQPEQQR